MKIGEIKPCLLEQMANGAELCAVHFPLSRLLILFRWGIHICIANTIGQFVFKQDDRTSGASGK